MATAEGTVTMNARTFGMGFVGWEMSNGKLALVFDWHDGRPPWRFRWDHFAEIARNRWLAVAIWRAAHGRKVRRP